MGYKVGHTSSTQGGKCVICNKITGTFLDISEYQEKTTICNQINTSIKVPVCDEHFNLVSEQKEILIGYAKTINNLFKTIKVS